jgi:uncharacterized Zn-binding protein involved in type VI secretion
MPAAAHIGDNVQTTSPHAHGNPCCPHQPSGKINSGAVTVLINGKPAARVGDGGTASPCCVSNTFNIITGSATVFIEGKPAARQYDNISHCGIVGKIITGAINVLIG